MTRPRRYCPPNIPVHVNQRGNNRCDCFYSSDDKATFFKYLKQGAKKYDVDVHAWVLMSNHFHLLLTPHAWNSVSRLIQHIGRDYVRYFNRKHDRSGTLWEGRFESCLVQTERYFLICQRYIELNPVRAGMVDHPGDFHWSSFRTNALGAKSGVARPHPVYLALGSNRAERLAAYRELYNEAIPLDQIEKLRQAASRGFVFGSKDFRNRIEAASGLRMSLNKRGRKRRQSS